MSKSILYIGPSGNGKTTSARTLDPAATFMINCLGKDLPWKGSAKQYTYYDKDKNPKGNMVKTSSASVIAGWMNHISEKQKHITDIVIDDFTFATSLELLRRSAETTWDKYNDIAKNFIHIAELSRSLRDDIVVHIFLHTQVEGDGVLEDKKFRAMSYGKLIDEKLGTQEAQFTIVLRAAKERSGDEVEYVFYTTDPYSSAKAPQGMFESNKIPNDLALVRKTVVCYYEGDC